MSNKVNSTVELYTDGSSIKNPGPAGLGYVIRYWELDDDPTGMPLEKTMEGAQNFRLSTNNRMEMFAAIYGLERIIKNLEDLTFDGVTQINLMSDSEYFVKAINNKWIDKWQSNGWMTSGFNGKKAKPVKNQDLWQQLLSVQSKLRTLGVNLTLSHVEGHADNEWNNRADELATSVAATTEGQIVDNVYEQSTRY